MHKYFIAALLLIALIAPIIENDQSVNAVSKTIVVPDDYPTIADAIGNATDDDTVFVKSGTYTGTITVNKSITLAGENPKTTILELPSQLDKYSPYYPGL